MEQLISLCQKKEHVCLSVDGHVPFYKQGTSMKLFCQALQPTQWPALICELDPQVAFVSALLPRGNQGFLVSVTGVTVIHFTSPTPYLSKVTDGINHAQNIKGRGHTILTSRELM
jgi:hypothetical protein